MGIASTMWESRKCRSEDGVLFASDQFVRLAGGVQGGYRPGSPEPLSALLPRETVEWIEVDPLCRFQDDASGVTVEAGGGSWEGDGFVAVISLLSGELIWVLHLSESEHFTTVTVNEGEVVALAEEYPFRNEFRIPLKAPHRLRVASRHDA
jgi:hypothetical protein